MGYRQQLSLVRAVVATVCINQVLCKRRINSGTVPVESTCSTESHRAFVQQFRQAITNIGRKDDESRFIGLGQLKIILESKTEHSEELRKNTAIISKCWSIIPGRFLDRLLRVVDYKNNQIADRDYVIDMVVSTIHNFVHLLPESRNDEKFAGMIDKLLPIIGLEMYVTEFETKKHVLDVLDALADTPLGSIALLTAKNWPILLELGEHAIVTSIDEKTCRHAFTYKTAKDLLSMQPDLHEHIAHWVTAFQPRSDAPQLFEHVHDLVRWYVPSNASDLPDWLAPLTTRLLEADSIQYVDAPRNRLVVVLLSAALVRCYPAQFPALLYGCQHLDRSTSRPAGYVFLQYRLVDIRVSLSSLTQLNYVDFKLALKRLTGCYELVSAFINFLIGRSAVMSGEDDVPAGDNDCGVENSKTVSGGDGGSAEEVNGSKLESLIAGSGDLDGSDKLPFSPDLLLEVRKAQIE
ncbi:MAG: hypothetical protein Q9209_001012 [Squamulea sp. 1 TL-2023]